MYNQRLLAAFQMECNSEASENKFLKFFRMVHHSRHVKKPLLLILIENPNEDHQVDFLIDNLINAEPTLALMLVESFSLVFMQKQVFYQNLCNASYYFPIRPFDGEICMYILFVKPNNSISIMHKIYHHDILDTSRVTKMLQEYLGLFSIVVEEDVAYRQEQMF